MTTTQTEAVLGEVLWDGLVSEATIPAPPPAMAHVSANFLLQPLVLEIEETEDGEVVVSEASLIAYGVGSDLDGAVSDFIEMLFELREELEEPEGQLSDRLRQQLVAVRRVLGRTH